MSGEYLGKNAWSSQLSKKIKDTITHLEKMKAQEMLSSQSGLRNVWEEICVQVQAMSPRFEDAARESFSVTMLK